MGILIGGQKTCFCLALARRANCCLLELRALDGTKGGVVPCAEDAFSQRRSPRRGRASLQHLEVPSQRPLMASLADPSKPRRVLPIFVPPPSVDLLNGPAARHYSVYSWSVDTL